MPIYRTPYFSPLNVSGCVLWFDAADTNTMTFSGTTVTSWTSKGSSAVSTNVAIGGTPTYTNPTYTSYNSLPALGFNGTSTYIQTANVSVPGTGTTWLACSVNLTPVTISTPVDSSVVLATSAPGERAIRYINTGGNNYYTINSNLTNTADILRGNINENANGIRGFMDTASYFTGFTNGTQTVSNTTAVNYIAAANQPFLMGKWASGFLNGYIYESLVYNRVLTLTEYQQVEGYLAQKWGFTSSLPAGHPGLGPLLYRWKVPLARLPYYKVYDPKTIPGLTLWFDAADCNTMNISTGFVTSWVSKGSAVVSTAAVSGGWIPPSFTTYSNRPALRFNGLSTYVQTNPVTLTAEGTTWITCAANLTAISANTPIDASLVVATQVPEKSIRFNCNVNATCYSINSNVGNTTKVLRQDTNNNVNGIRGFIDTAASFVAFGNGASTINNTTAVNYLKPVNQPFYMGAWLPGVLDGYIQEILIYDSVLTLAQYQQVEGYLAQKWGYVGSLSAGHPSLTLPVGAPATGVGKQTISYYSRAAPVYGSVQFTYVPISPYAGNQYLSASVTAPSTDSVTYECWFYQTTQNSGNNSIMSSRTGGGGNGGIIIGINTYWGGFSLATPTFLANYGFAPSLNTWHHIALVRNGSSAWTFYYDGIAKTSGQGATFTFTDTTSTDIFIGAFADSGYPQQFTGYVTNFRYVKGVAVYTGNFTVPTTALTVTQSAGTNISAITAGQTQLLLLQANTGLLTDTANNTTVTNTGSATWNALTPLPIIYGSVQLSGTNYLSTAGNAGTAMGTGDFTWECFVYPTSSTSYQAFIDTRLNPLSGGDTTGFYFGTNTGTLTPMFYTNGLQLASSVNITLNAWNHVALTRASGTVTLWINGASGGTKSDTTNLTNQRVFIGSGGAGLYLTGNIANLRIVKGTAVYTGTFSRPTTAVQAISGTQLLLNFAATETLLTDSSTNNFTITNTGTAAWNALTPF